MTTTDFIYNRLKSISLNFPDICIRYDYQSDRKRHLIEVSPSFVFHNDIDYMKAESDLESEFESLFPLDEIVFISSDSLISIRKVLFEFGPYTMSSKFSKATPVTIVNCPDEFSYGIENNYALAA